MHSESAYIRQVLLILTLTLTLLLKRALSLLADGRHDVAAAGVLRAAILRVFAVTFFFANFQ